jgi:hypothetical protein
MFRCGLGWRTLREPETLDNPPLSGGRAGYAGTTETEFQDRCLNCSALVEGCVAADWGVATCRPTVLKLVP